VDIKNRSGKISKDLLSVQLMDKSLDMSGFVWILQSPSTGAGTAREDSDAEANANDRWHAWQAKQQVKTASGVELVVAGCEGSGEEPPKRGGGDADGEKILTCAVALQVTNGERL
jgi:hypothetical protein